MQGSPGLVLQVKIKLRAIHRPASHRLELLPCFGVSAYAPHRLSLPDQVGKWNTLGLTAFTARRRDHFQPAPSHLQAQIQRKQLGSPHHKREWVRRSTVASSGGFGIKWLGRLRLAAGISDRCRPSVWSFAKTGAAGIVARESPICHCLQSIHSASRTSARSAPGLKYLFGDGFPGGYSASAWETRLFRTRPPAGCV